MNHHHLYIPIMNSNCRAEDRPLYRSLLQEAGCDTVFLALEQEPFFRKALRKDSFRNLQENVRFFSDIGLEVGIWARGFGFGTPIPESADAEIRSLTRLRSVTGKNGEDAFCPADEHFLVWYGDWFREICRCGAHRILVDDDLCQSVRPGIGCFCETHKALLARELHLPADAAALSDEALQKSVFTGSPGKERAAYLRVTGESLRAFCHALRNIADTIDPAIRLGFCAGYTSFDSEGATALELTKILAGPNRPFLRLSGAPYWVAPGINRFPGTSLIDVLEFTRMQNAFCPPDLERFHEADTYPRPRSLVPATLCEAYDAALRTEAGMGSLKYLFDYFASPTYETGYLKYHQHYARLRGQIDAAFADTVPFGIRVIEGLHKLEWETLPDGFVGEKPLMRRALTRGGGFVASLGFPTVYGDGNDADIAVCFGENARLLVGQCLPGQLILDTPAALILKNAGVDVGLERAEQIPPPPMMRHGKERAAVGTLPYAYRLELPAGAIPVTTFFDATGTDSPAVYRYRSGTTEFLVYAFDGYAGDPRSTFSLSYLRAEEIASFSAVPFPAAYREPGLYQICGRKPDGTRVSLFLNLSTDTLSDLTIRHAETCSVTGAEWTRETDGLLLRSEIPPYRGFLLTDCPPDAPADGR